MKKNSSKLNVGLPEIRSAHQVLRQLLPATPLILNPWLSESFGCQLYLKLETLQPVGSFKIRGAFYKIFQLSKEQKGRGVIAASAGNHAQGVAWASKQLAIQALIVMPKGAPLVKIQNTRALGAEVILSGDNYDQCYAYANELAQKSGKVLIPAYEDEDIIAGQGTLALEILDQLPKVEFVIGTVGGGGMMAGVSIVMKSLQPHVQVVGCQAAGAPSMIRSIQGGKAITLPSTRTFADGISVMRASEPMRQLLAPSVDHWVEVDEDAIAAAVLSLLEKAKVLVEGAGAASLAAVEKIRDQLRGKNVVVIVSGGNIDVNVLSRIIDLGLIRAGRRLRINVYLSDTPGSLAQLTELIAKQGANILQAIHDRNEPSAKLDQTEVALTLETRGPEHSKELIQVLKNQGLQIQLTH